MLFYWVVSDSLQEAVELLTSREEAEAIVQAWDRDEPNWRGILRVEKIELLTGTATSRRPSASSPLRIGPAAKWNARCLLQLAMPEISGADANERFPGFRRLLESRMQLA